MAIVVFLPEPTQNNHMNIGRFTFLILLATLIAAPLRAQSYDEAEGARTPSLKQVALLDQADDRLRRWLATNAEESGLDSILVGGIENLLKGWRLYTSIECNIIGATTGGKPTSKSTYTSMCEEGRYVARVRVVVEATNCLGRMLRKAEGETVYASACLEPLTPLKTDADYKG